MSPREPPAARLAKETPLRDTRRRRMRSFGVVLGAAIAAAAYAAAVRPRVLRWGATETEIAASYPGDDLIAGAPPSSTMATTIDARPAEVWPWLVQMGADRAGFYSFDRLDHAGIASATAIEPAWQELRVGDRIAAVRDGSAWFDVALLEPERDLVLRSSLALGLPPRPFDPSGPPPRAFSDSVWAFHLRPTPDGRTRLIVRGGGRGAPVALTRAADRVFWEPAHCIMQLRQFHGLRQRTEPRQG